MNDFKDGGLGYNVKKYHYAHGTQVRIYSKPLVRGKIIETKEVIEREIEELTINQLENKAKKSKESSMNRTIQSIYGIARANTWDYFLTLTFDPHKIDSTDYDLVTKKATIWLNNLKKRKAFDMQYILVPELHKDGKKWHVHGLLAQCDELTFVDSKRVDNLGKIVYNLENWKYGFSTVTRIVHSVKASSYIVKYINKDLCAMSKGKRRYWASKNCLRADDCMTVDLMTSDEIDSFIYANAERIEYMKTTNCVQSGVTVKYIELGV